MARLHKHKRRSLWRTWWPFLAIPFVSLGGAVATQWWRGVPIVAESHQLETINITGTQTLATAPVSPWVAVDDPATVLGQWWDPCDTKGGSLNDRCGTLAHIRRGRDASKLPLSYYTWHLELTQNDESVYCGFKSQLQLVPGSPPETYWRTGICKTGEVTQASRIGLSLHTTTPNLLQVMFGSTSVRVTRME